MSDIFCMIRKVVMQWSHLQSFSALGWKAQKLWQRLKFCLTNMPTDRAKTICTLVALGVHKKSLVFTHLSWRQWILQMELSSEKSTNCWVPRDSSKFSEYSPIGPQTCPQRDPKTASGPGCSLKSHLCSHI